MTSDSSGTAELAESLFRIGALRFGKFSLASGRQSSYYLDLRIIPTFPEVYGMAVVRYRSILEAIGVREFDAIVGVATAGVTISSPVAYVMKKPMLYARKEEKGHGLGRQVEGAVTPGWRCVVIDDLVTSGGSVISAVEALRKAGCRVEHATVLVDRLEGGEENLAEVGVKLHSSARITDLVDVLFQANKITKKDHDSVLKQVEAGAR